MPVKLNLEGQPQLQQEMEGRTILIVDDESVIRDLCSRALKGYRILQAEDGEQALNILDHERVDVVLADVMMPQVNGLDLLKTVKDKTPNQIVVIMTGYADKEIILRALKSDADDFITKPMNLLQLKTTIDKVLEKKALKEELLHLKRLDKLKSEFLGLVSHKLKTPITAISLFIQNLSRGFGDPSDPTYQQTLALILDESKYLGYLIKDLLFYSEVILREGPPELSPCNLRDIAQSVAGDLNYSALNKGVVLTSTFESNFPEMSLDRKRISFALRAVLENAIKFTHKGGTIHLMGEVTEKVVRLIVKDTGQGIPADELPKVFEKFYQVDPDRTGQIRGFGLGLFYARQFIGSHGGRLLLESTPEKGTIATIELPFA
ncbi:MAG: hybrid sensor histidine kinase/response regulator [Desulfuromonadaceae bacterium GWC2_58_13]|nr:MAG: hybrid sensor histidine kinase/response regulator [Desulfuromonadaceae bacterium GWC2_58_13]